MLDARRQEVWTAVYEANLHAVLPAQPLILEHNLFQNFLALACRENPSARFIVSGNGGLKLKNVPFVEQVEWSIVEKCSARYLAALAERLFQNADFQDVSYFEPYYMKPPNITAPAKVSEP